MAKAVELLRQQIAEAQAILDDIAPVAAWPWRERAAREKERSGSTPRSTPSESGARERSEQRPTDGHSHPPPSRNDGHSQP
jgi:hypothetical protein